MTSIGIGALAKRAGVSIDTVRYYEKRGLFKPETRLACGYRRYGDLQLFRLRFICRAQELGFTLKDVSELGYGQAKGCPILKPLGEESIQ